MIRRIPQLLALALLAAGTAACEQSLPTGTQAVELALVAEAAHVAHSSAGNGANIGPQGGAPFRVPMSQELTTTVTGDPDGTGFAKITINIGQRQVCWDLHASGILLGASAAHIHRGAPGLSGPIVIALTPPDESGRATDCAEVADRDLLKEILQQSERFYVNVHTFEFPAGAIRGQLSD